METNETSVTRLRKEIIGASHEFLQALDSGRPTEDLLEILHKIKDKEAILRNEQGLMLDPELWKFFYSKLSRKQESTA